MTAPETRLVTPTFALVTLASLFYFAGVGMTVPVLPHFVEGPLGGGDVAVGVAAGSLFVAAAVLRPGIGRLGDRLGRRLLVVAGAAIVAIATAGYTLASTLPVLVLLRLLSGVGEAGLFVGAATAIQDLSPDARRGEAASYFSVAIYGGLAVGPAIGEAVADARGYDAVWLLSAACCAVAVLLGRYTPVGELAPPEPGRRRRLLHPAALAPGTVLGLSLIGFAGFSTFVPLYAEDVGLDGSRLAFILYAVVVLGVRIFGARVPDRFGPRPTASTALAILTVSLVVMAAWREPAGLLSATALLGLGTALLFPSVMRLVVDAAPVTERSSAVATLSIFFDLSQGVGALALGGVVAVGGRPSAFVVGAVAAFAGLVVLRARVPSTDATNTSSGATSPS